MKYTKIIIAILAIVIFVGSIKIYIFSGREISEKYFLTHYYEMQQVVEMVKSGTIESSKKENYTTFKGHSYTHQLTLPLQYSHLSDGGKIYVSYENGCEVMFVIQVDFLLDIWSAYLYSDKKFDNYSIEYYGIFYYNWKVAENGG